MLLLAALIAAAPPGQQKVFTKPPHSAAKCERADSYIAGAAGRYDGKPPAPQKLTELPPANMYVAVDRFDENGCLAPIVVKTGVGR